jgi:phenylpropionate dioxygenase-like ring-hydroxylating dioxygenase large terminal subunit
MTHSEIPVEQYFDGDFYAREKDGVWRASWLLVGRLSDVPAVGDYFVFELAVLNTSLLIIRGKDDQVRAFHNACIHHGAKLRYDCSGSCKQIRCSFHGWTYDLQGKLIGLPLSEHFPTLDLSSIRLKEVAIDSWGGFVFVHLGESPQPLAEFLHPLPEPLAAYLANEDWHWYAGYSGKFKANWKIFVDNQCEGHHAAFLHQNTIGAPFTPEDYPTEVFPESPSVMAKIVVSRPQPKGDPTNKPPRQTELARIAASYSKSGMWTEKDGSQAASPYPGAVNAAKSDRWVFDLYVLFPNVVFLFEDDQIVVQRAWPLGPHETYWEMDHYFVGPAKDFAEQFNRELSVLQQMDTISEDTLVCEGIHSNCVSGAIDKAHLSDLETGIAIFQNKVIAIAGSST